MANSQGRTLVIGGAILVIAVAIGYMEMTRNHKLGVAPATKPASTQGQPEAQQPAKPEPPPAPLPPGRLAG